METPAPQARAEDVRCDAFSRLTSFSRRSEFDAVRERAFAELWGAEFRARPRAEQDEAQERPEALAGHLTYCVLDIVAQRGRTVAECFLAKHVRHVPRAEVDYLRRLASTRMGLYRIDDVQVDRGLRCLDLWTGQPIEIREKTLTHSVKTYVVVAARTFPAADGATEFDGAIYAFSEPQAREVVEMVRAEWAATSQQDPRLDEQTFLKRRFPVLIHQYWFEQVFFGANERPAKTFGVGAVQPHDRASDLQYFRFGDPAVEELAVFLHSPLAPTAMAIDELHGFLCAVNCGPSSVRLQKLLPPIAGDEPMQFDSQPHRERVIASILELSRQIAEMLSEGTFAPLLPSRPARGMDTIAQRWCSGFLEGMALHARSWDKLMNDSNAYASLMPIVALLSPEAVLEDTVPIPKGIAAAVAMLPGAIATIREYCANVAHERTAARTRSAVAARATRAPHAHTAIPRFRMEPSGSEIDT